MQKRSHPNKPAVLALFAILALVLASCSPAAPSAPAPATETPAAQSSSAVTTTTDVSSTTAATTTEAVSKTDQSGIGQITEQKGISVKSDEDVVTPRNHYGGEYHDVSSSDAVSFHPYLTTDTASSGYQSMVYTGGLLRLNEKTLAEEPNMAEAYEISPDGLTFTFHLRHDMLWSDGQPITAQDFKWTYDQVINPKNEFPYLSQLDFISSYVAKDDYTLEIKIKEVYAPALDQMSGLITPLPKHVWEKLDWKDPAKNPEINSPTVVSGPYKLQEWKRDQYAVFVANDKYWYHGRPNFDKYTIEIVPDQDVTYQKMKSGETDTGEITPDKLEEARTLDNVTVYEWWPAAASWTYVGLNMREGFVTHDVNVRHGLAYAIDKDLLTQEVMKGQAKRLCSAYPETSWVYNPNVECYNFDTNKAIDAFKKAGYSYDGKTMVGKDGKPLTLKLIYGPNTSKTRQLIAVTVQDYLSKIGVKVDIQALEWASFLDAIQSKQPTWDMFIGGWSATIEPHIMYTIWAEQSIPDLNAVAYINKDVEKLFTEGGATYDVAKRKEKYQAVQKILADDAPYIFLYYQKAWSGQNKRIQGIVPSPLGIGWNQSDWYVTEQ